MFSAEQERGEHLYSHSQHQASQCLALRQPQHPHHHLGFSGHSPLQANPCLALRQLRHPYRQQGFSDHSPLQVNQCLDPIQRSQQQQHHQRPQGSSDHSQVPAQSLAPERQHLQVRTYLYSDPAPARPWEVVGCPLCSGPWRPPQCLGLNQPPALSQAGECLASRQTPLKVKVTQSYNLTHLAPRIVCSDQPGRRRRVHWWSGRCCQE